MFLIIINVNGCLHHILVSINADTLPGKQHIINTDVWPIYLDKIIQMERSHVEKLWIVYIVVTRMLSLGEK